MGDKAEEKDQKSQKMGDIIYGRPLTKLVWAEKIVIFQNVCNYEHSMQFGTVKS